MGEQTVGGAMILTLAGRLTGEAVPAVERSVLRLTDGRTKALLIDLAQVDYVSSTGLRVLLVAAKRSKAAGCRLCLSGMLPTVREVFDIAGFTALFTLVPDRAAGLAKLA